MFYTLKKVCNNLLYTLFSVYICNIKLTEQN
nr:MAG TPA: hypothetical protein [Caudoviricetes sp.]